MFNTNKTNYIRKILFSLFAVATVISGMASSVNATETNLPESFLIGDNVGIHADANGNYYFIAEEVKPGDVITKTLTIHNIETVDSTPESGVPYRITLRMEPISTVGPFDLLDTRLELKLDGSVIYSGTVRGDGDNGMNARLDSLDLGSYAPGNRSTLDIKLTVRSDADPKEWKEISRAEFVWHFIAHRDIKVPVTKTGVTPMIILSVFVGIFLLLAVLCIIKKLKKKRKRAV